MLLNNNSERGKSRVYKIAFSGIFSALVIVVLLFSSIMPTMKLSLLAIASFVMGVIVCETDIRYATLSYIAISVLSLLFVPSKTLGLLFLLLFGLYPIIKILIEKFVGKAPGYILKIAYFNFATGITYLLAVLFFREVALDMLKSLQNVLDTLNKYIPVGSNLVIILIMLFLNVSFVLYDLAFGKVMIFYEINIRKFVNSGK